MKNDRQKAVLQENKHPEKASKPRQRQKRLQPVKLAESLEMLKSEPAHMPQHLSAAGEGNAVSLPASFDAVVSLNGAVKITLSNQTIRLSPEQTKQLAKMLRFTVE